MEYASADPSVVRSIRQRVLLDAWLRATRKPRKLPALIDFDTEIGVEELTDMMGFAVEGEHGAVRFRITQEGTRLAETYGNDHIDPHHRINRYLDEAIGANRYAGVVACYHECLLQRRPVYSITAVSDADGRDVTYERLLLPFGGDGAVEHIIGSYKTISIDGGFKVNNLMGVRPMSAPARLVSAVIDRDVAPRRADVRASDEVVELD
jgi:hypothetical protein